MKVALGALLMGLLALVGCSSDGETQPTEVVTETVTTETTEAQTVVEDMDKKETPAAEPVTAEPTGDAKFVTTSLLNVRSGPGMSFGIVRVATFKEKLSALESTGSWVKVGEGEYVSKTYLSDSEPSAPSDPAPRSAPAEESAPADTTTEDSTMPTEE